MGSRGPRPWVFLGHTFERVGPPIFLLHFLRWLAEHDPRPFEVISLTDGALRPAFEELCPVTVVDAHGTPGGPGPRSLGHLSDPGLVYVNTAISVRAARLLPTVDAPWIAHVHELEVGLALHTDQTDWTDLDRPDTHWIAASEAVAANLTTRHGIGRGSIEIHHEMIDASRSERPGTEDLTERLAIPAGSPVIGTVGVVNWRKAPDLFLELAWRIARMPLDPAPHFVWVGGGHADDRARFGEDIRAAGLEDRVHLVAPVEDPIDWMRAFSVFVLPAREDAFPLACLEAASVSCPTVCFDSGGMPEFVESDAGVVVPYPDLDRFALAVADLLRDPSRRVALGDTARSKLWDRHHVGIAAPRLHSALTTWAR